MQKESYEQRSKRLNEELLNVGTSELSDFLEQHREDLITSPPVDFMQKYMNADPASMVSMLGDYYSILARYTEFAEKIDAFDESELTNAELAYYLEVTNRVSQKLLRVAG